jgi:Na+/citrate or Na+/malate symporter
VQADLINGATFISLVTIAVTFVQADLINGAALISFVAIAVTFVQADLINGAIVLKWTGSQPVKATGSEKRG